MIKLVGGELFRDDRRVLYSELSSDELRQLENITNAMYPELLPRTRRSYRGMPMFEGEEFASPVPCPCPDVDIPEEVLQAGGERLTALLSNNMSFWDASRQIGISENALRTWFSRFRRQLRLNAY